MGVDADRLRDLTLELVEIESPTGDTAAVAWRYANILAELGLAVEVIDEPFPATPIVIGRLRGGELCRLHFGLAVIGRFGDEALVGPAELGAATHARGG